MKVRKKGIHAYVGAPLMTATLLALAICAFSASPAAAQTSSPKPAHPVTPSALAARGLVLTPGTGYGPRGSHAVRALQSLLTRAGYPTGPLDGRYGPRTEQAVMRYQADDGLQVDGIAGPHTLAALHSTNHELHPGAGYPSGSSTVRHLQRLLAKAGTSPGPIDGLYGPLTEAAVMRYQRHHGLSVSGVVGRRTFAELSLQARGSPAPAAPAATSSAPPAAAPAAGAPAHPRPAAHGPGSIGIGWLVLLVLLGAALAVGVFMFLRRRGDGHLVGPRRAIDRPKPALPAKAVPAQANGDAPPPQAPAQTNASDAPPQAPAHTNASDAPPQAPVEAGAATTPDSGGKTDPPQAGARSNGHRHGGGTGDTAPSATFDIDGAFTAGAQHEERRELAAAEASYGSADEHGHPAAASNLGVLLEERGDLAGAEAAYRRADQRGEANGAFNLGVLLEAREDLAGAEAAYRRADARGHTAAASNLGVLLESRGDRLGAEAAYRRADARGGHNGAFNLGVLLEEKEDLAGAEAAYRRAEESSDSNVAQLARDALLDLAAGVVGAGAGSHDGAPGGT